MLLKGVSKTSTTILTPGEYMCLGEHPLVKALPKVAIVLDHGDVSNAELGARGVSPVAGIQPHIVIMECFAGAAER